MFPPETSAGLCWRTLASGNQSGARCRLALNERRSPLDDIRVYGEQFAVTPSLEARGTQGLPRWATGSRKSASNRLITDVFAFPQSTGIDRASLNGPARSWQRAVGVSRMAFWSTELASISRSSSCRWIRSINVPSCLSFVP